MKRSSHGREHPEALAARVRRGVDLVKELDALFPDLVELDSEARKRSLGKLRDGEADAMRALLDAADRMPAYFVALAERDGGDNPTKFETAPTRAALSKRDELAELQRALKAFSTRLGDTLLVVGAEAREITTAAYAIARANAAADPKLRAAIAPAVAYYARGGRPKKS